MKKTTVNPIGLESLCGALAQAVGVDCPKEANAPDERLAAYLSGRHVDRLFMYNPDAVAEWIADKYAFLLRDVAEEDSVALEYHTVMPSVTPVCFGTMYTGALPEVHGIRAYMKPVIRIESLFDAYIRAGKKPAIVCTDGDSMSRIYLERDMDYFFYPTVAEVNAKAAELIAEDRYDMIAVYNGNYDSIMHKFAPEGVEALGELRANAQAFATFREMIRTHWQAHDTLLGFAMDHGCHEIDGGCGSHGLDMPEDLNIRHIYQYIPAK